MKPVQRVARNAAGHEDNMSQNAEDILLDYVKEAGPQGADCLETYAALFHRIGFADFAITVGHMERTGRLQFIGTRLYDAALPIVAL